MRLVEDAQPHTVTEQLPAPGEHRVLGWLALFSSTGTLVCCALPSLLVLLGLGATVATVLSAAPWLVTLSRHKGWVFTLSGLLIAGNFLYLYRLAPRLAAARGACRPGQAACGAASRVSRAVLWLSASLYLAGFAVAFLLPVYLEWLDR